MGWKFEQEIADTRKAYLEERLGSDNGRLLAHLCLALRASSTASLPRSMHSQSICSKTNERHEPTSGAKEKTRRLQNGHIRATNGRKEKRRAKEGKSDNKNQRSHAAHHIPKQRRVMKSSNDVIISLPGKLHKQINKATSAHEELKLGRKKENARHIATPSPRSISRPGASAKKKRKKKQQHRAYRLKVFQDRAFALSQSQTRRLTADRSTGQNLRGGAAGQQVAKSIRQVSIHSGNELGLREVTVVSEPGHSDTANPRS